MVTCDQIVFAESKVFICRFIICMYTKMPRRSFTIHGKGKGKAIPVTGRGDP
jgi:hypothetical protein